MRLDMTKLTLGVDNMLPNVTNPLHRAILLNYRRHAILEVSGRYKKIFTPEMTVEIPKYKIFNLDAATSYAEFIGPQVPEIYKGLVDKGTTVMMLEHENISVADWGFSSESLFHYYTPGRELAGIKHPAIDDPDAMYDVTRWISMHWPYDESGRMIGEHVYQAPIAGIQKLKKDEIWYMDEVWELLSPLINEPAPLEFA